MRSQGLSPVTESSEEGRSFLQRRVALFWKVMLFLCLFGVAVGASGAIVKPGLDFVQYMAPESLRAPELVDARTDIYMLGAVAYYLLAGSDVFDGQSILEVCFSTCTKRRSRSRHAASRSRPS